METYVGSRDLFIVALGLASIFIVNLMRRKQARGFLAMTAYVVLVAVASAGVFYPTGYMISYHWFGQNHAWALNAGLFFLLAAFFFGIQYIRGAWGFPWDKPVATTATAQPRPGARAAQPAGTRTTAPDVFISYKREERSEVKAIAARLEGLALKVWFDAELRSGTTFDAEIDRQARAAKCILVCWSPGAVASDWVRGEATIGRERDVLAAGLLKPCNLPPPFNLTHSNDLRAGIGPQNPEWLALLDRIGALVGRPGLAAFESLGQDRDALGAWLAQYPKDPLAGTVLARLQAL